MKKLSGLLMLVTLSAATAVHAIPARTGNYDRPELRTQIDSVSYSFGNLLAKELIRETEFIRQTFNIETFLAGIRDGINDTSIELGLGIRDIEYLLEERYETYISEARAKARGELDAAMEKERFIPLEDGVYYKVTRQGTGRQATKDDQMVKFHYTQYDTEGNPVNDTRRLAEPEESLAFNLFNLFDGPKPFLCEGTVFEIRCPEEELLYDEDPDYICIEYEIISVEDY